MLCNTSTDDQSDDQSTAFSNLTNTSTPIRPHSENRPSKSMQLASIMNTLGESNKLLTRVVERLDNQEQKMEQVENKLDTSISSSSSTTPVRSRSRFPLKYE